MFRESTLWDIIPVAPLLGEIAWDQNDPYNMLCPVYYGTQRSATGCAATAMAQIMKYHSYPPTGAGSHSYRPDDKNMGVISMDFSQSEYDWGNMTPRYGDESAEEEKSAVAKLMYELRMAKRRHEPGLAEGSYRIFQLRQGRSHENALKL